MPHLIRREHCLWKGQTWDAAWAQSLTMHTQWSSKIRLTQAEIL